MVFRDTSGQILSKNSRIAFSMGLGNTAFGSIIDESSGLGLDGTPARQPVIVIQIAVVLPADPNGFVAGVVKLPDPVQAPSISED